MRMLRRAELVAASAAVGAKGCPTADDCLPTYADQLSVRRTCDHLGYPVLRQTGTCAGSKIWEETDGAGMRTCAYDATGALEFSKVCSDTGGAYGGRVVIIDSTCALVYSYARNW